MQRLSMIAFTAVAVLALSGAGFTQKSTPAPTPTLLPALSPTPKAFVNYYYWYDVILEQWNDYATTSWEIWEMETYYDCTVNTDPAGGTLIEEGFITQNYPNPYEVMVFLYAHF